MRNFYLTLLAVIRAFVASSQTIVGTYTVCAGGLVPMTVTPAGGTWASSNTAVAYVAPATGMLTGITAGTTNITYTAGAGYAVTTITVNNTVGTITGTLATCVGGSTTLSCATPGGTWSSSDISFATITSTGGVATGVSYGYPGIAYTLPSGCLTHASLTVNMTPTAITGPSTVCDGSSITLSSTPTWGTWSSGGVPVAVIGPSSGIATGLAPGTSTISYTLTPGCISTKVITVNPTPAIGGTSTYCLGSVGTVVSYTPGGTWSSSATTIATVGASSGIVTALATGPATITYTTSVGCSSTFAITVNALTAPAPITGPGTVCEGSTITMSSAPGGGTWASDAPAVAYVGSASGVVTAASYGTATITYVLSSGCYATRIITANTVPTITGTASMCVGGTATLSATPSGGYWTSGSVGLATVDSFTGIVTGVSAGSHEISYHTAVGCSSLTFFTVNPTPAITGTTGFCVGGTTTLSSGTIGGTWTSASPIITVGTTTGIVSATAAGTVTITYTSGTGCFSTIVVTASAVPSISLSPLVAVSCSPLFLVGSFGADTYSWTPMTGITYGITTDTVYINPTGAITYTVTGTIAGCSGTTSFTALVPNRILGHLSFSGPAPSGTSAKVWLIQYDPTDSSITATDSMLTCLDGGAPYYEFTGKPAGSYLVKAKLLSSVAGTSDYLPTYGASAATWDLAAPVTHATASDSQHVAMLYGTVPSGPGFISGYVYMGAGKGTSGEVPAANMIVYLKNATTGSVLTYTYTDVTGAYSFGSLAFGSYIIYPEEMSYYTTPSPVITLSAGMPSFGPVGFKKRTTMGIIEPWTLPDAVAPAMIKAVELYPNPANDLVVIANAKGMVVSVTDVTGREVYNTTITSDSQPISIAGLADGVYMVSATNATGTTQRYKLVKQ